MFRRSCLFLFSENFAPGFLKRIQLPLNKAVFGVSSPSSSAQQFYQQQQQEKTEELIKFICTDLNIGFDALTKWRNTVQKFNNTTDKMENTEEMVDPLDKLLFDCRKGLGITISPAVSVQRIPNRGIGLVATRNNIPAGMFLCSVPCSSIMTSSSSSPAVNSSSSNNKNENEQIFNQFFQDIEELSLPLLESLSNNNKDKFHNWVKFLFDQTNQQQEENAIFRGVNNLPYFAPLKLQPPPMSRLGMNLVVEYETRIQELLKNDHQDGENIKEKPNKKQVFEPLRGVPERYLRWAASTVLSRRISGNMLVPIVDFANHSPIRCNSFYTMAPPLFGTSYAISGLDFIDNLFSGVSTERLFEPHLHLFSIAPIRKGEEITMSYSDVDPNEKHFSSNKEQKREDDQENEEDEEADSSEVNDETTKMRQNKHLAKSLRMRKKTLSLVERLARGELEVSEKNQSGSDDDEEEEDILLVDCGSDNWRLLYGFEPEFKTDTGLSGLTSISKMIVKNRIVRRQELFPR
jgi:hypothetical protein